MGTIDSFDLAILKLLQVDNTTAQRDIADQVGLSAAAVQRRIKRLRESGTIMKEIAVIDREQVGSMITVIVEVSLHSESIEEIDRAKALFAAAAEVQQCYYVTGAFDFLLVILIPSMKEYEKLTRRIFFSNENVKSFETTIALDTVKLGMALPLEYL